MTIVDASTTSDRARAAVELLGVLYPPPLAPALGTAARDDVRAAWLAIPKASNPRLLVPANSATAAVKSMRRQLTGQRTRTRVARSVMSVGIGSGLPFRLPYLRVVVTGPADAESIEDPLRDVLGVDHVSLSLPIGPARANRKPVLQVTGSDGTVLAFAKVGHNDLTKALVSHESAALSRLATASYDAFRPPHLVAMIAWHERAILVLEPLTIPDQRLSGNAARQRLFEIVAQIAAIDARPKVSWALHPHRQSLEAGLDRCGAKASVVAAELARLDQAAPVGVASWHGDLNSGNLALVQGPCPLWDWERFESGAPLGFDLMHHDLHQAITVDQLPPRRAADLLIATAASTLGPLGVDAAASDVVVRSYLLTLAQRYLGDRQDAAGADLGRVEDWLLPALAASATRTR